MSLRPRIVTAALLLALVPVGVYAFGVSMLAAVALLNVLIVVASLYYMFSPSEASAAVPSG